MSDPLRFSYSDNAIVSMADRLTAEVRRPGATRLDIATGYFAVSAWPVVGGAVETLQRVRILIGKDYELTRYTRLDEEADVTALVRDAILRQGELPRLPERADAAAVGAFIDFLERPTTEVRAWRGEGFLHAKAYILDSSAGVGSSNFTAPGLLHNRELVTWRQDDSAVRELREWFEGFWGDPSSVDYKDELLSALRATPFGGKEYRPYDVLIRVLAERYGLDRPPSLQGATFQLKWFQEDAVVRLIKLLDSPARGALLADAVGLGKTFMAMGVIHHFLHQQREMVLGRPVTLVVPASLRKTWSRWLDRYGLAWAVDIVHVQNMRADFDVSPFSASELVVIDEAHRLRGRGTWFQKVMELLTDRSTEPRVLLLTATPVNTSIQDLTTLLKVITKNRRHVWAPEIPDFERYLARVERNEVDPYPVLDRSLVRRSRSDILAAMEERRRAGQYVEEVKLPERRLSHEEYSYTAQGDDEVFSTFASTIPTMLFAPYDLGRFRSDGARRTVSSSLAGLYLSGLLKRFESSLRAIRVSLRRLDRVLARFADALDADPPRILSLEQNPRLRQLIQAEADEDDDEIESGEQWEEALAALSELPDPGTYDLESVRQAVAHDRGAVANLLQVLPAEENDGKVRALIDLLRRRSRGSRIGLAGRRVLVFTQFRDTAEYLAERLPADIGPVALTHGGITGERRAAITQTFDPDFAELLPEDGAAPPAVLVSTDVLAEGHNLQLAQAVVNYDLHWNPQIAVQRSGRVDRLNSPHSSVYLVSFLPEEGLNQHLGLIERLDERFQLYKHLGLADEPVTRLRAEQLPGVSFEQLRRLYRDESSVLDEIEKTWTLGSTDYMRQPLDVFLRGHAIEALRDIPVGVQSAKWTPRGWPHGPGVFVALAHGEGDNAETFWRFYPLRDGEWRLPLIDDVEVFRGIVCTAAEPRATLQAESAGVGPGRLVDWDLLRRAAAEVAADLTARRATAAITRGASEQSARLRAQLLGLSADLELVEVETLLDRLEQVRVEDFDVRPGYRPFKERVSSAGKADSVAERRIALLDVAERGLELFGPPETSGQSESVDVRPEDLRLVAWELLQVRPPSPPPEQGRLIPG